MPTADPGPLPDQRFEPGRTGYWKVALVVLTGLLVAIAQGKWWVLAPALVVAGLVWWEHAGSFVELRDDGVEVKRPPIDTGAFIRYGDIVAIDRGRAIGKMMFAPALETQRDGTIRLPNSVDGRAVAEAIDERIQLQRRGG
ncbi:MAG: hypothetical protein GY929_10450 [Actinomycetia bacterium]|nr:hypothetical protein [Actinomycetes bacterium]